MLFFRYKFFQLKKIGRRFLYHTIVGVIAITVLLGLGLPVTKSVSAATFDEQTVRLINSERQKINLPPLIYSDKLFQAA